MKRAETHGIISATKARRIWRDLAWMLGDRYVMIIGYGDESYSREHSEGYIIAGWFAHIDDWNRFSGHWQNALNEKHAPYLHMRELDGAEREKPDAVFHDWDDARVRDFVERMIPIVTGHAIFGLSCAIDVARHEKLPKALRDRYRSSYSLAFQFFFEEILAVLNGKTELRHNIPATESCSLVFDQVDADVCLEAHYAFNQLKLLKQDGNRFGTLAFVDSRPTGFLTDNHCLPSQAADLLANRSFKTYKREIDRGDDTVTPGTWDMMLKERYNLLSTHAGPGELEDFARRVLEREARERNQPPTSSPAS